MKTLKLVPEETHIDFIGKRYIAFALSLLLVIGSLALVMTKGLNFGIDFTGGTLIEIRLEEQPDLVEMRKSMAGLGIGSVSIQEFGEPTDVMIRLGQQEGGEDAQQQAIDKVRSALDERYGDDKVDYRRTEFVGPQVGEELKKAGFLAVLFSLAGILIYIWLRFEWQFGVASIVALVHDTALIVGLFALTQMEFNLATVAAILMIAGYSINDTVVVFDRIRETLRKYKKKPLPELFNMAINEMLSRTIMTSVTTLLALFSLWLFGGEVIRGFVDALLIGIVVGTYSSVFIAAPVLLFMNLRPEALNSEAGAVENGA